MVDNNNTVIGTIGQGIISYENPGVDNTKLRLSFTEIVNASRRELSRKTNTQRKSITFDISSTPKFPQKECIHASIQYLDKVRSSEKDIKLINSSNIQLGSNNSFLLNYPPPIYNNVPSSTKVGSTTSGSTAVPSRFALLVLVWKETGENSVEYYSASVCLLVEKGGGSVKSKSQSFSIGGGESQDEEGKCVELKKVTELMLVNKFERKFHAHLLPPYKRPDEESDTDTTEETKVSSFKNRIVILNLDENVIQFSIETFPHENHAYAKMILLESEMVTRCFWWAQWVPQYQFLVLAIDRKIQQSTFDEEETPAVIVKPMLSVLQFHNDFPRESVLNMPLDVDTGDSLLQAGILVSDPNIISSKSVQLKVCAHASGAVYLFSIRFPNKESERDKRCGKMENAERKLTDGGVSNGSTQMREKIKYSVNLLHHNKTLTVECDLKDTDKSSLPLKMDVSTFANDQYLAVIGWPSFVHILDVGVTHEPSHHITLDFNSFISLSPQPTLGPPLPPPSQNNSSSPFLLILQSDFRSTNSINGSTSSSTSTSNNCDDKLSTFTINFARHDLSLHQVHLSPVKLHQLLEKNKGISTKMRMSIIHYILVHVGDVNVCKRIIYDEGKRIGNLSLTKIYQEFIVGAAYAQTKKQLLPNMEPFLSMIPYCPQIPAEYNGTIENLTVELTTNWTEVCTMLLSPSQRVFPHNVTDVWTSLWNMNKLLQRTNRFSHKNVADKLLLALQCYKPEALSKASTPMSPSSPMVCASLGDIAGLFGRRTTELQLPFVEHESCTANKQEYIFSINLRELSMHLLKERKEYPLLGHTVAGKYVCALVDTARLLCHLACLTVHLQPTKTRDKGFRLIDCTEWETKLRLFMLLEHYALALGKLACPLPQGFTPFFAYLAYKTLSFDQFIWHVRAGTFELQIDLVKTIMTDLKDSDDVSVSRKLRLLSLLPKSRAYRILNHWSHPVSVTLRARQHSSDLLSGTVSQARKSNFVSLRKKKAGDAVTGKTNSTALDSFFQLLTGKANANDIDLGLLTEATMLSMEQQRE